MPTPPKQILVVGGGLAGIAAALALAQHGGGGRGALRVTLLESRHALGGRASSFENPENPGELLDNCQHVLLGCCTNLLDLYTGLGVQNKITFHKTVHFLDAQGRSHNLRALPHLPAPLHLGPALALFSLLTPAERFAVIHAQLAMLRLGKSGRDKLEPLPFGEWLDQHHQSPALIKKFYDPILISALNEETRKASAKYAIQVFQDSMLAHRDGYLIGLPNAHLGELYANLPEGIDLRLDTRVEEILFEKLEARSQKPEGWRAAAIKLRSGETIQADAIILATNYHAAQRFIPADLQKIDLRFPPLALLQSVPILGVHLFFDRPIMQLPAAALVDGPLQWLFRKDAEGKTIHGVISAARTWTNIPRHEALPLFEAQIRQLFPHAKDAVLLRAVSVIEKRATFSPLPNTDPLRPEQAPPVGGIQNLYLAGDYTKTDWPATMEGAVRSGYLAAESLLKNLGILTPILKPDLAAEWPASFLGLAK